MTIDESRLRFCFEDKAKALKYDESSFYRRYVNQLPSAKGVDFISIQEGRLIFTEVKNFKDYEFENMWRIWPDNKRRNSSYTAASTVGRDSLDVEISEKVAMTIGGLIGAYTKTAGCEAAEALSHYAEVLISSAVKAGSRQLLIILFLEGDFGCETRPKKVIMRELERSIKKKLSWLNCLVSVVDSDTYQKKIFQVERLNNNSSS